MNKKEVEFILDAVVAELNPSAEQIFAIKSSLRRRFGTYIVPIDKQDVLFAMEGGRNSHHAAEMLGVHRATFYRAGSKQFPGILGSNISRGGKSRDLMHMYSASRRSRKEAAQSGELDDFVWQEAKTLCSARKRATGIDWHADHMIPLKARLASGLHNGSNCQVIPAKLNISKSNRLLFTEPGQWIAAI